jgi:4-amino-4-deoxy-L-arabinose transferase-like glycosyltransferase
MNLGLVLFFLYHYGFLALFTLFAYLIGARLTGSVPYHSASEKFCFSTGLGLGVIAYFVFAVGLARLLTRGVVLVLFTTIAVLLSPSLLELARDAEQLRRRLRSRWTSLYGIILVLLSPILLLPLYPPTQWDATSYHLAAAKIYANSHAVVFTPYLRFPVFPQLNEMLFSLMLLLYDDISAQLVQFLMMWLVAITLYAWGRRAFSTEVGLWSGVLWLSNPVVLSLGASAYIDIGLTLFVVLAAYAFFNWYQSHSTSWLLLSAVFFGFAAGSKYLALFPLAVFGLFLLYWAAKERRFREVIAFTVLAAAVASPWYIRNLYYTGNPVWPYFGSKLGYGNWNPDDLRAVSQEQASYGTGKGITDLIMLPWNLVFHGPMFHADSSDLSPVYLLLLPLSLIAAWKNSYLRTLLVVAGLYTLSWFSTVQVLRYLLLAVPFLSLVTAAALDTYVFGWLRAKRRTVSSVHAGIICILLLGSGLGRATSLRRPALPPATSQQRDSFLGQSLPSYPAYEFLNHREGSDYTVYALDGANMAYFADGHFIGDWFGPARYSTLLNHLSKPEELYEELHRLGAQYLLIYEAGSFSSQRIGDSVLTPGFLETHFKIIYARSNVLLFEVDDHVEQMNRSPELLRNGGFEMLNAGIPMSWSRTGKPLIDSTGANSHNGKTAVRAGAEDWLAQRVALDSGRVYLLRSFSRAMKRLQFARLQINWLDRDQKLMSADIEVVPAYSTWHSQVMAARAPDNAAFADVYASVHGDSEVWLDDFSLVELRYK